MRFPKPARRLEVVAIQPCTSRAARRFLQSAHSGSHRDIEYVQRVVDGDTLLFGTGERVRLIGVETPETKHPNKPAEQFDKEASAFNSQNGRRQASSPRV